jgi:hypothetical protein
MTADETMLAQLPPDLVAEAQVCHVPHPAAPTHPCSKVLASPTAMKKWRIVILGFGTARQKTVLD